MSRPFDHRDPGTDEHRWARAAPWATSPHVSLDVDRIVVVAAHPDDETLGAGGLLHTAAQAGIDVTVIVATDGEAGDPALDHEVLAGLRRQELVAALRELAPTARLRFLGLPDGGLDRTRDALGAALRGELGTNPWRVLLLAPWAGDGHRDHRIAGEEAIKCAAPGVRVVGYPVWLWHWAQPDEVDASDWVVLPLAAEAVDAKARALDAYRSQREGAPPMLHPGMLAHFARDVEVFAAHDIEKPPSISIDGCEEKFRRSPDPWGFRTRWYERRKRAILLASLPRERFDRALELGCANGELTADLADRCTQVVAVDGADSALRLARDRLQTATGVVLEQRYLPDDWPEGVFDLVIVSEIAYYWSPDALADAIARIDASLTSDGVIVLCHWRHPMADAAISAGLVHAAFDAATGWARAVHHGEEDFVLDVHVRAGTPSVARAEAG